MAADAGECLCTEGTGLAYTYYALFVRRLCMCRQVPDVGIGVEKAEMWLWERHYFIYAEEDSRQWQNILSKD
ncbi:hypothetical protein PPOP_3067 [Paenibacillus popilliae ATCC 14706]|uniref:Uncharacterized protein n=1 Tax=Paenibacillus popilliae ATCC 14706 TaxID=1212764 RepID=M9M7I1_PAEPP|nr:hypothetical protein PPOP_3067 [Paenibacillus popilliae ATCC 14706]